MLLKIWKFITSLKLECGCSGCKRSNYYHKEEQYTPPSVTLPPVINVKKCGGDCKNCKNCSK